MNKYKVLTNRLNLKVGKDSVVYLDDVQAAFFKKFLEELVDDEPVAETATVKVAEQAETPEKPKRRAKKKSDQ